MRTLAQMREDKVDEAWLMAIARGERATHPDPKRAGEYRRLMTALAALPYPEPPGRRR